MNPKTFQVSLSKPFGLYTQQSYLLYLHVATREEAFAWVARVFEGIDIKQAPYVPRQVGTRNMVNVVDCDAYSKRTLNPRRPVKVETPEGFFRKTSEDMLQHMSRCYENLKAERVRLFHSFRSLKVTYERDGLESVYERLALIQQMHARALRWEESMRRELQLLAPPDTLEMPQKRSASVAA